MMRHYHQYYNYYYDYPPPPPPPQPLLIASLFISRHLSSIYPLFFFFFFFSMLLFFCFFFFLLLLPVHPILPLIHPHHGHHHHPPPPPPPPPPSIPTISRRHSPFSIPATHLKTGRTLLRSLPAENPSRMPPDFGGAAADDGPAAGGDDGEVLLDEALVWHRFHEAPAFRNGLECADPTAAAAASVGGSLMCDDAAVHVAMTLDANYLRGSVAAVLSILKHAACPESVVFHFVAYPASRDRLSAAVRSTFPYLRFHVYPFSDAASVRSKISPAVRAALEEPLNYARAYLPRLLPRCLSRVIYLDSDLIVLDDIARLWAAELGGHPLGAPEYCHANFTRYFTDVFWADPAMSGVFEGRRACYFNTGVMVMELGMWRDWGYTEVIEEWMEVQKEVRIYELGSLPPFLLVFAGDVAALDRRWNQHGLGGDNLLGRCRDLHPGPVSLLHWSGRGKPWVRLDNANPCPLDSIWAAFDLVAPPPMSVAAL